MSNGVRNLRAMFENSKSASPEPRGRSPVDAAMLSDSSDRPRSRVRASFVPVEPPPTSAPRDSSTDLGQTKGTPSNSVAAHRRESFRVSQDKPDELAELKKAVSEEKEERRQSVAVPEAVPEQAVESRESSIPAPPIRDEDDAANMPNLGSIMKGSDFPESSTRVEVQVPAPVIDEVNPTQESAVEEASEPSPKASPVLAVAQPADNPDKATTGAQEDVALRPAVPTEEAVDEHDKPAVDGAAAEHEAAISDESSAATQPAENPDKPVTGAQEEATLKPAAPTDAAAVTGEASTPAPSASSTETSKPAATKAKTNGTPATKKQEIKKPATISTTKAAKAPISAAKSPLPKAAPKTPPKPKAATPAAPAPKASPSKVARPLSQAKSTTSKEPSKAPVTKAPALKTPAATGPAKKTSRTSLRPPVASSTPAPTGGAAVKPKAAAPVAETKKPAAPKPAAPAARKRHVTSPTGFKKPAPKSPTRPVGLPSRLTAPTAASAAKHGEEQAAKKPATTARPATKIAAPKASRSSIAPSATTATKRPESRTSTTSSAPKGGFLERMMRPTAASSSKTHEKPHEKPQDKPASPPSKAAAGSKPSTLQKGKKKVEEVAAKVKDAVTNGHDDEHKAEDEHKSEGEAVKESDTTEQAAERATVEETPQEPAKAATPVQDVESSTESTEPATAELQTPTAEAETVR
ncbi:hypothetical protein PTNB73_07472 [Pyrenophora teres f. teres]|uniref:Uncharacterized protein n=1 Tax=Pyrenophora teres f. teres TaxID=97479 RepID=A0A6S6WDT8_9PLEO|nr:hypothetical protein PTNB85_09406 [Pyrenophora teres f. teres]KAE8831920.1 hypothetical protein HRS9139_06162 [Pyrenophora teres f. teres]KAE8835344.1 hypothetical protein HRS9122_07614 [Pyrenophora teres f. teres]KAE8858244.1 hypothetical protein PTNB29_07459 [Pyrenophora teres f. teres]KAE8861918.1 hypothetical protein PTNB73_07472 [Pyrenophora teres f. teres]